MSNNSKHLIQQGDVLLIPTTASARTSDHVEIPLDAHGRVVLALGESSGHAHVFRDPGVCLLRREGVSERVLTVEADTELLHDQGTVSFVPTGDHAPVPVKRGTYIVRTQREWAGEEARDVQD